MLHMPFEQTFFSILHEHYPVQASYLPEITDLITLFVTGYIFPYFIFHIAYLC